MESISPGETLVCRWKDNKTAAYSVGGDDSLRSQLFFAIPEMDRRGLCGTWWVNPGRGGPVNYKKRDDEWAQCWIACYDDWKAAAARGHDFGNHTLHHLGAASYAEAEDEIRRSAEIIWETNPRQRLQLFLSGGGTIWGISREEIDELLVKYDCVRGRGGGIEDPTWEVDPSPDTLRGYVDAAIQEGSWHLTGFHGIGSNCEWGGPVSDEAFIALLDYLVEKGDQVWCATHTEVHKYDQERSTAGVQVLESSPDRIRLALSTGKDTRLYDAPLTLRTRLPEGWARVRLTQAGSEIAHTLNAGMVQYNAVPGKGEVWITV